MAGIVGFFDEQSNGGVHSFSALSERIDQCDAKSILRTKYVHIIFYRLGQPQRSHLHIGSRGENEAEKGREIPKVLARIR
jgi:hypothetical protein